MKKKLSLSFTLVFIASLVFANIVFAKDENICRNIQSEESYLLSKGYNSKILDILPEEVIHCIYNRITFDFSGQARVSAEIVSTDKNMECVQARGAINKTNLKTTCVLNNYANPSGEILGCDISILCQWISTPNTKGPDAITINWDDTYFSFDEASFDTYFSVMNTETNTEDFYGFDKKCDMVNTGGMGWYVDLQSPNISPEIQATPSAWAMVFFNPNKSFTAADNIVTNFTILYTQNKLPDNSIFIIEKNGKGVSANGESTDTLRTLVRYRSALINN